jgi:hypothetical protein
MLAVLLLGITAPYASQAGLLREIVPDPTGNNGYEEYLAAADIVRTPDFARAEDGTAWVQDGESGDAKAYLKAAKDETSSFAQAVTLVRQGNTKGVTDPRPAWVAFYPEARPLKLVARLMTREADVEFGDGKVDLGVQTLLDGLQFSWNMRVGPLPMDYAGKSCEAVVLSDACEHLAEINADQAARLLKAVQVRLSAPRPILETITKSGEEGDAYIQNFLAHPDQVSGDADGDGDRKTDSRILKIQGLSQDEKRDLYSLCIDKLNTELKLRLTVLRKADSQWGLTAKSSPAATDGMERLAAFVVEHYPALQRDVLAAEARHEIQLRLFALGLQIAQFKSKEGRLPTSLEEVKAGPDALDPTTGKQFVYAVDANGNYTLVSEGFAPYGQIWAGLDVPDVNEDSRESGG